MISRTQKIDEIIPLFKTYLGYMSRFFEIHHFDSWVQGAIKNLTQYALKNDRHLYISKQTGTIIGFALVSKHLRFNTDGYAVADFFIHAPHTGKGHGRRLAEHIFLQFPGHWEVAVTSKNDSGMMFWDKVLTAVTNDNFLKQTNTTFNGTGFLFNTMDERQILR